MVDILIVDLDGTLIKTDMLHESFWSSVNKNWIVALSSLSSVRYGKAALKVKLSKTSSVDVARLPYNQGVIDFIKKHREAGGRSILITGSTQSYAEEISNHCKLFDEAYGSGSNENLTGEIKRAFILKKFGGKSFSYMGNSRDDLAVWQNANKIITVDASGKIREKAENFGKPTEHIQSNRSLLASYLKLVRVHQWVKNLLIFLPIIAAHQLDKNNILNSFLGFLSFSFIASSVYILNDLLDLEADRSHPRKRLRPLAAGDLSIVNALTLLPVLMLAGFAVGWAVNFTFLLMLTLYLILTTVYSIKLKAFPIIDIIMLSALYSLRVVAGGVSSDVNLSFWLIAFSTLFFLALASVKRQAELVDISQRGLLTVAGRGYQSSDLPIINTVSLVSGFVAVQVLALYINSEEIKVLYQHPEFLWGICFILLFWIIRLALITNRGFMSDDPVMFTIRDRVSYGCLAFISIFLLLGI